LGVICCARSDREVGDGSWIGRKRVSVIGDTSSRAGEFSACGPGQMEGKMWRGKVELQAFRGKVRDLEVSREKWRVQAEETEDHRRDLAQQLERANEQLEERIAALEAEQKNPGVSDRIHALSRSAVFA
jgi:hypothetical protein